jgi:hypothetical protein
MKLKFDKFDFFNLLIIPIYLIIIIFSIITFTILYLISLPSQCILYIVEKEEFKKNSLDFKKNNSYNKEC